MHALIAPDRFTGRFTAAEVAACCGRGASGVISASGSEHQATITVGVDTVVVEH